MENVVKYPGKNYTEKSIFQIIFPSEESDTMWIVHNNIFFFSV